MSTGMLKMLGLSETTAKNETEYIEIAVRLGLEPQWRQQIVQYIGKHKDCLFDDNVSVAALEKFYQQVVRKRLMQS
jgi:predicted O-linked N-acetylglucosamine transferase (SPINDLY family)